MNGADRLIAACRRAPVDATPVWFMRQAGGSLPDYIALRERYSVEEIARTPELCARVSLMPVDVYGVDGAVMYADIMLPLVPMGVELELTPSGPVIASPVRTLEAVRRLRRLDPEADLPFILEAIGLVRRELAGRAAVIGIVGGPFTLASYLVEGGPSRDHARTKAFMVCEPEAWSELMRLLTGSLAAYAAAQVRAGAQIVHLFDSWAGVLAPSDYAARAAPHASGVLGAVRDVPTVHFVAASAGILELVADAGGDVIAIDHGQSLAAAWDRLGRARAVQGNLDPARLLAGWPVARDGARHVLEAAGGRPGHIFNLGHAAPRATDPGILRALATYVHDVTGARNERLAKAAAE